ncbi:MAG: hypothetical protein ACQERS_11520 [Bacteroidota bacterium]
MGTNTTNTTLLDGFVMLALAGTLSILPSCSDIAPNEPTENIEYSSMESNEIMNENMDYDSLITEKLQEKEQAETLLSFSQKLVEGSKDVDSDIIKFVDENFWDLF